MECQRHGSIPQQKGESRAFGSAWKGVQSRDLSWPTALSNTPELSRMSTKYDVPLHPQALPGKLTLHEADLLKKGSFDEVVKVSSASLSR